ncbi:PREDICTED: uncharacterized protein LOC104596578 [Nelumbo nucifera]|uniref:Bifunctional inhibitor/plant lipid transfer protein/seed storage helical domain-containing protein n=2 Tax=Nelumbo nucifera TaxID=4432 RepID=A0A822XKX6_NELNU|nr:PREDICTED: uncharacterized protein LOC104596578 [Nelumbo nucifera]DAD19596.1 TPA_asm: hypothetical protein HUJ06_021059 [Nelumbo nucifera]
MGSKGLSFLKITWVLTILLLCFPAPSMAKTQFTGCSFQDIDLQPCFNFGKIPTGSCCKAVNQVVKAGYKCLCSMISSTNPLFSAPISFLVSNCHIFVPPLAQCRVPTPAVVPPDTSKEPMHPLLPPPPLPKFVPPPMPPDGVRASSNLTRGGNITSARKEENLSKKTGSNGNISKMSDDISISYVGDNINGWLYGRLLLIITLHALFL